ncbi:winged helix-turn-helix domain-containing protein [Arsukibacterium ikkense]|uniref:winged helix-turn-helix domain-containing protein n=1 Tax=Arsukibacterium ikkense TaxID=336831 RepID=UPI00069BEBDE|nr:winged helix-turn-helix domain-containing protein [Arsukibacterium ikkense]
MVNTEMQSTFETVQLSQKAFLLVSILKQQVTKSELPPKINQQMTIKINELNSVLSELSAYIMSLNCKNKISKNSSVTNADGFFMVLDESDFTLRSQNCLVRLTKIEFMLHKIMAKHPKQVFTRSHLIDSTYNEYADISERTIDCHIRKLRAKHRQLYPDLLFIHTMYGAGYYYSEPVDAQKSNSITTEMNIKWKT